MEETLRVIMGKWKLGILSRMMNGEPVRPSQLLKEAPDMTRKVLLQQLQELEEDGIVSRTLYAEVPPKVEYRLTEMGKSLESVLISLDNWGKYKRNTSSHSEEQ